MSSCSSCSAPNPTVTCPSRMADGRAFTDYRPRCLVNAELMQMVSQNNMAQSSYESRMFLQSQAELVMERERSKAVERMIPCAPCKRPFTDPGTMAPERYTVRCDTTTCTRVETNPAGIGDGRNYAV